MPQFFISLFRLLPYLPALIHTAEVIHGPGGGTAKLKSVVELATVAAPEIGAHVKDPVNRERLENTISAVVGVMNAVDAIKAGPGGLPQAK